MNNIGNNISGRPKTQDQKMETRMSTPIRGDLIAIRKKNSKKHNDIILTNQIFD